MFKMPKKRVKKNVNVRKAKRNLVFFKDKKFNIVLNNLILFVILFVLFLVLDFVTSNDLWSNLFGILRLIFGFVALAFLIVLLIFLFTSWFKK